MTGGSVVEYVLGSSVRSDVLLAVVEEDRSTEGLIEVVDASESAVYNAVGDLERKGLVRAGEDGWRSTGSGHLVADILEQQENLSRLLADDYWENHDVASLPRRFRLRLTELADADVFRARDTDPHAVIREVCERVEQSGPYVDIVTPIYQAEYEGVMPDVPEARLIVDRTVALEALDRIEDSGEIQQWDDTSVRVLDADVGIGVTDDHLMLSLPTLDGHWDSRTEVFATDDRALEWGRDLFEYYWDRATPTDAFVAEHLG